MSKVVRVAFDITFKDKNFEELLEKATKAFGEVLSGFYEEIFTHIKREEK